jgi:Rrf2 family protein
MTRLALDHGHGPARKKAIAEAEGISADYVEQIFMRLRTAGLVRSHRGLNGGFSLAREPDSISVGDVLKAVEDELTMAPCRSGPCGRASACATREVWQRAEEAMQKVLGGASLAGLARRTKEMAASRHPMFDI